LVIYALSAPSFLAAKLEAFEERGLRDIHVSKDLEDIVMLLDCRLGLADEIATAPPEIRAFIATKMERLLANYQARDVISDVVRNQGREHLIVELMHKLTQ